LRLYKYYSIIMTRCHYGVFDMPKTTFYNIDKDKQQNLIHVGIQLFSINNYEEVDVKTVVEAAGLPRGSFYAYFDDMEDYYTLIISSLRLERIKSISELAKAFKGNLFDFLVEMFKYDITQYENDRRKLLLTHYFRFLQSKKLGSLEGTIYHSSQENGIFPILLSFDINQSTTYHMTHESLIEFTMSIYLTTYNYCLSNKLSEVDALNLFNERIRIIERGVK